MFSVRWHCDGGLPADRMRNKKGRTGTGGCEDAQTIQVYLWTTSLYENEIVIYPGAAASANIRFIVAATAIWIFMKILQQSGLPDIITCCRFSLRCCSLKDSLMNLALIQ